ncbi:hypothetical protein PR202_ga10071 [Eleusine coracana subsp. coracana]|uniref:Cytidyltransferase-like domain-containing protein n=1 Tax=Eleusine coracana subsp. coracana TaxID=191504 RepID=A0AAV5C5S3_ELECO|nr:hypothetical protein PR202_ga10071 [Eleusine coracana subsp. coracana]
MESWVRAVVEAIHSSRAQAVLYLAGGASQALGWLLSVPGASGTVLEVVVPYSRASMAQLLDKMPLQFTSKQTAEDMALAAYNRALKLSGPGLQVMGVGFTGSLASSRPKHGDHRFFVSTRTHSCLRTSHVTLSKGLRSREDEDKLSSYFLLKAIADTCKVSATIQSDIQEPEVPEESREQFDEDQELQQVINGQICMKVYHFDDLVEKNFNRKIILPGSFNPLHDGHLRLLEVASRLGDELVHLFNDLILSVTGTTFLVGGRKIEGVFKVLEDLDIPGELRDMFISIPEEKFRLDISSTELREKGQKL